MALSRGSPRVAVGNHPALWSPDFPRRGFPATRPPGRLVRRVADRTLVSCHSPPEQNSTPSAPAARSCARSTCTTSRSAQPSTARGIHHAALRVQGRRGDDPLLPGLPRLPARRARREPRLRRVEPFLLRPRQPQPARLLRLPRPRPPAVPRDDRRAAAHGHLGDVRAVRGGQGEARRARASTTSARTAARTTASTSATRTGWASSSTARSSASSRAATCSNRAPSRTPTGRARPGPAWPGTASRPSRVKLPRSTSMPCARTSRRHSSVASEPA